MSGTARSGSARRRPTLEEQGEIPVLLSMVIELNRWLTFGISAALLVVAAVIIVLLRNQEP
jgi:hypothetical protein